VQSAWYYRFLDMAKELAPLSIRIRTLNGCVNHRHDGVDHWPVNVDGQKNCFYCLELKKYNKTNIMCEKCNVYLHLNCFKLYHVKEA